MFQYSFGVPCISLDCITKLALYLGNGTVVFGALPGSQRMCRHPMLSRGSSFKLCRRRKQSCEAQDVQRSTQAIKEWYGNAHSHTSSSLRSNRSASLLRHHPRLRLACVLPPKLSSITFHVFQVCLKQGKVGSCSAKCSVGPTTVSPGDLGAFLWAQQLADRQAHPRPDGIPQRAHEDGRLDQAAPACVTHTTAQNTCNL